MPQHTTENYYKELIQQINACSNCKLLASIVRNTRKLFHSEETVEVLQKKVSALKPKMKNSDIAGLLNVLSKARVPDSTSQMHLFMMSTLAEVASRKIHCFSARDISVTLNSLAKQQIRNDALFQQAGEAAIPLARKFTSQGLANTVHAFAKMGLYSSKLFDMVARAAVPIIDTFNAQALSIMVHAFGKTGHMDGGLFAKVAKAAIPIIDTFQAQELAMTVNAFAKMGHHNPELYALIAKAAVCIIHTFKAQELANTATAFAKMDHPNPELFDEVAKAAILIKSSFNAQDLAMTVNAFAKMDHQSSNLFHEVAAAAISIIHTFNAKQLAMTVNAFAKMDHQSSNLFHEVAAAAISIIHTFNAKQLAMTVNAFAKLNVRHNTLFEEVARAANPILDTFASLDIASLVSSFSKARAHTEFSDSLFAEVAAMIITDAALLSNWEENHLVEVAYGFMQAGLINTEFANKIGSEVVNRGEQVFLDERQLGKLAAAFDKYETLSSKRVLEFAFRGINITSPRETGLQTVTDLANAIPIGQRLGVLPLGFLEYIVNLAIEKSSESRPEDVRDILLSFSRVDLDEQLHDKLLVVYSPYFKQYSKKISAGKRSKIINIFARRGF
jgi:hypothetical protein